MCETDMEKEKAEGEEAWSRRRLSREDTASLAFLDPRIRDSTGSNFIVPRRMSFFWTSAAENQEGKNDQCDKV